ncbi:MAG: FAD-binding oxidoreductase [Labilithrix sp.]|nr:FAD-binding oxidoreductase [Labilithrix sp.]MCW5811227.1 FAD-binding oxidoreductase [Labilithrix sp.]
MTTLAGWGANVRSECVYKEPETPEQLAAMIDRDGTIARGLGRSYGDAALNAGKLVLGTRMMNRLVGFDPETGVLACEGGVSLAEIIRVFGPRGWFPMITPGTKFVTVGGCIANDIHGKAHHAQGSFSSCVDAMTVLLASGEVVTASRTENADLFWASFGGMGLLGVVLTATIRLRRIETTYFRQKKIIAYDLEGMMDALDENDHAFPYSVATLDIMGTGTRLGGGVLVVGDHATREELPEELAGAPLLLSPSKPKLGVPFEMPEIALNRASIAVVNELILFIQRKPGAYAHYENFFYPLDMIADWYRGYGHSGFTQYQFVIPFADAKKKMRQLLEVILSAGELPFLNILKRMGKESGGLLSFPREGYTFAIDFPIRPGTVALLRKLDAMILDAGGRIYLGKDSYVEADTFRAMYPRLDEWLALKAKYDPKNVFTSDLGRRVGLVPG